MDTLIYIGEDIETPLFTFNPDSIISISINSSVDLLQVELQIDTAEVRVFCDGENDVLNNLAWKTPLFIYQEDGSIRKFYTTKVKRVSRNQYDVSATSYIGFLDDEKFYGGVYNDTPFPTVIEQIVRTDGLRTLNTLSSLKIDKLYQNQLCGTREETWFDVNGITHDMRNGMYIKFKFNGFHNDEFVTGTVWNSCIAGFATDSTVSSSRNMQYGIFGTFTRSSASVPYPETTELFFRYMQQEFSIGTPSVGDVIEVDCIPSDGIVIINGVTHQITARTGYEYAPLDYIGGGRWYSQSAQDYNYDHHVNLEIIDYKVTYYANGDILMGFCPLFDFKTNKVYYRNGLYGGQFEIPYSDPKTVEFSNIEAPGTFPHDFRKEFVESISYAPEAENYRVNGWIPICTKREAIHQLLLSSGLSLKKDADGNWFFSEPQTTISANISENNIYSSGEIDYSNDIYEVILKEHYFKTTEYSGGSEEVIFTSSNVADTEFVAEFTKQPSKITTFTYEYDGEYFHGANFIYCKNENAALVPSYFTEIKGYPYIHQEKVYTATTDNKSGSRVSVENATTITPENSVIMLQRLINYYIKSHTCKFGIIKSDEKCGMKYSFVNPFLEEDSGYLVRFNEKISSISKAECEFLCGYVPVPIENGYSNYVVLTGSGVWAVPESVFEKDSPKIRVVLVGGGDGGFSGCAGENGASVPRQTYPTVALGGEAGNPGNAGHILDVVINNPSASYTYSSGVGGTGGDTTTSTSEHNSGSSGSDSTLSDGLNNYSSANGEILFSGHTNFISGDKYGLPFKLNGWKEPLGSGIKYGDGGNGGYYTANTIDGYSTATGNEAWLANVGASQWWETYYWNWTMFGNSSPAYASTFNSGGGCGGGSGIGEMGQLGQNATSSKAGNGGNGGNATWIPPKATDFNPNYYGYGGHGGGGGGAGGASGYAGSGISTGSGGSGGYGGRGGDGGDGCILIYY